MFVLTDGEHYVVLPEAKDYKRIGDGDTGLNTGGMGAVSPVPFVTPEFVEKVENRIIKPTIKGLKEEMEELKSDMENIGRSGKYVWRGTKFAIEDSKN